MRAKAGVESKFLVFGDDFEVSAVSIEEAMEKVCEWILHTVELHNERRLRGIKEGAVTAAKRDELMDFFDAIP